MIVAGADLVAILDALCHPDGTIGGAGSHPFSVRLASGNRSLASSSGADKHGHRFEPIQVMLQVGSFSEPGHARDVRED